MMNHQPAKSILIIAYNSLNIQVICFGIWFCVAKNTIRLHQQFWILFVSASLCIIISGFAPALGPVPTLGIQSMIVPPQPDFIKAYSDVIALRSVAKHQYVVKALEGIIVFPSFHAVSAISSIYGFRGTKAFPVVILLNVIMIFSTPFCGQHYLVDILAGTVVACISIAFVWGLGATRPKVLAGWPGCPENEPFPDKN